MSASSERDTGKTYFGFKFFSWVNRKYVDQNLLPQQRGIAYRVFYLEASERSGFDRKVFFGGFFCLTILIQLLMFTTGAPLIRDEGLFLTASYSGLVTWDWALMLYDVQTQLLSIKEDSSTGVCLCLSLTFLLRQPEIWAVWTLFCTVIMAAVVLDPNETVIYLARLLVVPFNNVVSVIAVTVTTAAICVQIIPVVIYGAMNIHRKLIDSDVENPSG